MIRSQITNEAALFPAYSCPQRDTLAPPARSLHFTFHVAVEVIPPAGNTVDALALEGLLSSLRLQVPFALEIAADKNGSHFIARARRAVLAHLCSQLENVYGQVEFHPLTEEKDPARQLRVVALIEQFEPDGGRKVVMGRLHLRRFEALPLRTYRDGDFREADPILGVLGGFGRVAEGACPEPVEGEQLLSQLLLRPAPDDWADGFQSLTRPPDMRIHTSHPLANFSQKRYSSGQHDETAWEE